MSAGRSASAAFLAAAVAFAWIAWRRRRRFRGLDIVVVGSGGDRLTRRELAEACAARSDAAVALAVRGSKAPPVVVILDGDAARRACDHPALQRDLTLYAKYAPFLGDAMLLHPTGEHHAALRGAVTRALSDGRLDAARDAVWACVVDLCDALAASQAHCPHGFVTHPVLVRECSALAIRAAAIVALGHCYSRRRALVIEALLEELVDGAGRATDGDPEAVAAQARYHQRLFRIASEAVSGGTDAAPADDLSGQVVGMLLGAANGAEEMAAMVHALGAHPNVAAAIAEEVSRAAPANGPPALDALCVGAGPLPPPGSRPGALSWTAAFVREVLRLHPGVNHMTLVAQSDAALEGAGPRGSDLPLRTGDRLWVSPHLLHRLPRHWRDAAAFDPSRHWRETPATAYMPFAAGVKRCPASRLALAELTMLVAGLVARLGPVEKASARAVNGRSVRGVRFTA